MCVLIRKLLVSASLSVHGLLSLATQRKMQLQKVTMTYWNVTQKRESFWFYCKVIVWQIHNPENGWHTLKHTLDMEIVIYVSIGIMMMTQMIWVCNEKPAFACHAFPHWIPVCFDLFLCNSFTFPHTRSMKGKVL